MNYVCIGFDVRMWPFSGFCSMENSYWEQNEEVLSCVKNRFQLNENLYQLLELDISARSTVAEVSKFVSSTGSAILVAFLVLKPVAVANNLKVGFPAGKVLEAVDFRDLGTDVGDINGFFTVLPHVSSFLNNEGQPQLIRSSDFELIAEVLQVASFIDGNHSPYAAVRVLTSS